MSKRSRIEERLQRIIDHLPQLDLAWSWSELEERWFLWYAGKTHLFTNSEMEAWLEGFNHATD